MSYSKTVLDYFTLQVNTTPDAVAVSDGNVKFSYRELNQKANQLACWLQEQGVSQGDFVALLFEPNIDFVISVLAIIKVGGVYVPLDTKAPAKRLEYIINDSNARLVITNIANVVQATLPFSRICHLQYILPLIDHYPDSFESSAQNAEAPICLFYTSGTTGNPKGALISQQAVINLNKVSNFFNIGPVDVVAQISNLAFDAITVELWGTLLNGAALLFIPSLIRADNKKFKQFLFTKNVSSIFLPTSYFHQLIDVAIDTLDSLSTIFFGGEAMNLELIKKFLDYRRGIKLPITLLNSYGPTEATTFTCYKSFDLNTTESEIILSIGKPIDNVQTYVLDNKLQPVTPGEMGELYISGVNLAIGHLNSPMLDKKNFIPNPFRNDIPFERMYKTGDLVKELTNGELQYVGRIDDEVKVSGYRIHPLEIELQLVGHPAINDAVVLAEKGENGSIFLIAYLLVSEQAEPIRADELSKFLSQSLPPYMLPVKYLRVAKMPLNHNGKIDKQELKKFPYIDLASTVSSDPINRIEMQIKSIWENLLNLKNIDVSRNLFDLGANSLMLMSACFKINQALTCELSVADILSYPSIRLLTQYLSNSEKVVIERRKKQSTSIAIVGMACRFPQAKSLEEYWDNLCGDRECLTRFPSEDNKPNFVPVRGIVSDIDQLDALFFGLSPSDACSMDPQQRVFLECAWEAFEHAGAIPQKNEQKRISVFCGMADSSYLQENLLKNQQYLQQNDWFNTRVATSIGTLSTQLSYRLNLNGTSVNINTACSTSLVAVTQACQDLMAGQSDIALAGAISIDCHYRNGYVYQEGGIESPDGQCRPFAEDANGTMFSDGVGAVVLKRLDDAIQDNDTIYGVIKGCGTNNDGANRLGYTAPSVDGQTHCIQQALSQSGLTAEQIGFVEAHGTATALGDVIEFKALAEAYKNEARKTNYCVLGSVKGHIGHTDIAAGMAGLIKAALCLYHKKIPPTRHFKKANPHIPLQESPFYINDHLIEWESHQPRHAGVSAFGIGGTNAHVILSEHLDEVSSSREQADDQILIISGKTKKSLKQNIENLSHFLETSSQKNHHQFFKNIAYTLQTGRHDFEWRCIAVGKNPDEAVRHLNHAQPFCANSSPAIVFMFSGQGTQYPEMALSLLESEPYFSSIIEYASAIVRQYLEHDILTVIRENPDELLYQTQYTQPALFIIEYALAKLLMHYGIQPQAMIGHSIGEYVAACLGGVFSFEDALKLVCQRGLLMAKAPKGAMLAIDCGLEEFSELTANLPVDLALHNSIHHCVAAGSEEAIDILSQRLTQQNVLHSRLKVGHAFHSYQMEEASHQLKNYIEEISLSPPQIPIISNVTGRWLTEQEATSADYWAKHLRQTVWFKEGIDTLIKENYSCFIEVGPGETLAAWAKEVHHGIKKSCHITHIIPNHRRQTTDQFQLLSALGGLWQYGSPVKWSALHDNKHCRHISLPTYAFQRQRYWIEPDALQAESGKKQKSQEWFYQPSWVRQHNYDLVPDNFLKEVKNFNWIIFKHSSDSLHHLISILQSNDVQPFIVEISDTYRKIDSHHFLINIQEKSHYELVFHELKNTLELPPVLLHLLCCQQDEVNLFSQHQIDAHLNDSFYSALWITQAVAETLATDVPLKYALVTQNTQQILTTDTVSPVKACLMGIHHVVPQEHPSIKVQLVDIKNEVNGSIAKAIIHLCVKEPWLTPTPPLALREGYQWKRAHVSVQLTSVTNRFKDNGVYLCTGGLGGVALTLCEAIANQVSHPTFVLLSRRSFPSPSQWQSIGKNKEDQWHSTVKMLQRIQKSGANVEVIQCDITEQESLQSTIDHITRTFSRINGLIHAAGIAGGTLVQRCTKDSASPVLAPKVHGTYCLAQALQTTSLDFVMLCSSIGSLVGITGLVDYSSANACLDAFTESRLFHSDLVVSVNWNTWKSVGMAVETQRPSDIPFFEKGNDLEPEQAQQLFLQIMGSHYSNVAVSCFDLDYFARIVNQPNPSNTSPIITVDREELPGNLNYVAPKNSTEAQLVELWQTLLGIEPIGIEDDFFTLGGHSLKALKFIEAANKKFKEKLSLQDLYERKTIARLAQKMESHEKTENSIVKLAIQPNSIGNVFLLPPVAGNMFCFNTIVAGWDSPFSLYGLQDPSISTGELEFVSLADMAKFYLEKIKQVQPNGPYHLVGYSFGGTLAYEIAHLLKMRDERVGLLMLIDSWSLFSEMQSNEERFKQRMQACYPELPDQIVRLAWQRMKLLLIHTPSSICQDMLLFKANQLTEGDQVTDDAYNGWKAFNQGNIKVHIMSGNHETIMSHQNSIAILGIIKNALSENSKRPFALERI